MSKHRKASYLPGIPDDGEILFSMAHGLGVKSALVFALGEFAAGLVEPCRWGDSHFQMVSLQ